jgi:hypothetical protein
MGSIHDEVTEFFNLPNPSGHNMTLGFTQPPCSRASFTFALPLGLEWDMMLFTLVCKNIIPLQFKDLKTRWYNQRQVLQNLLMKARKYKGCFGNNDDDDYDDDDGIFSYCFICPRNTCRSYPSLLSHFNQN